MLHYVTVYGPVGNDPARAQCHPERAALDIVRAASDGIYEFATLTAYRDGECPECD